MKLSLVQVPWGPHNQGQCALWVTGPQLQPWHHTGWGLAYVGRYLWKGILSTGWGGPDQWDILTPLSPYSTMLQFSLTYLTMPSLGIIKKKIENRPIFKELPVIINKGNKSHGKVEGKVMKGWWSEKTSQRNHLKITQNISSPGGLRGRRKDIQENLQRLRSINLTLHFQAMLRIAMFK